MAVASLLVTLAGGGGYVSERGVTLDVDLTLKAGHRLQPQEWVGGSELTELVLQATTDRPAELARARLLVDGEDVTSRARPTDEGLRVPLRGLPDGRHVAEVVVHRGFPFAVVRRSVMFGTDSRAPGLQVTYPVDPVFAGRPTAVTGSVRDAERLLVNGKEVAPEDGRFRVEFALPPEEPVTVEAVDAHGNVARTSVPFDTVIPPPRRPDVGHVRAVHVTAYAWATPSVREPILDMLRAGLINAVELDLKDESGVVGYSSQVPLARQIGAARGIYDLRQAIEELHALGAHVIGRIVAFRDPVLATAAWNAGERDLVLQRPDGTPYAGYGGFTNFAHPKVRQYNIDIAREAAAAGIDDILYDYVRRPDGPLERLVIPGLSTSPEVAVASFVAETRAALDAHDVLLGASVYGIAATRPRQIAQDIPAIAQHVDYVAPMLYPSHWAAGEYDVPDPNNQPYEIIRRSLPDFQRAVEGTSARVVPWLQDFSLGVQYGPQHVRAQILAAREVGVHEWLLWNPSVRYTRAALEGLPPPPP